jgi:hypothetical protein
MNLLGAHQSPSVSTPGMGKRCQTPEPVACRRHTPIAPEARSCCCPADPVAQVIVMTAGAAQAETDILLCAHHLRRSAATLRALGAAVYDQRGELLDDIGSTFAADRRESVTAGAGGVS